MTFQNLGLMPELMEAVNASNYERPTPIQSQAIPIILEGKDLIGAAQTGTGKTAAFVLPLLQRLKQHSCKTRALVLTPTRELAVQVETAVRQYSSFMKLKSVAIYGGVSMFPQQQALQKGADIVVATPGRLLDLVRQGIADLSTIEVFVLDEADRMLDMGFLPDIRQVVRLLPSKRQTLLFSATLPPEIHELTRTIQNQPSKVEIGLYRSPAEGVTQHLYPVPRTLKNTLLLHLLNQEAMSPLLVFTRTKHRADRLHQVLERHRYKVARIHSGRSQGQRQQALEGFRKEDIQILVATDIMARGIDVRNISHVINFDTPNNVDDYIHRIGRTGRAQKVGKAYTFVSPEEESSIQSIEKLVRRKLERVRLEGFDYQVSLKLFAGPSPKAPPQNSGRKSIERQTDPMSESKNNQGRGNTSKPRSASAYPPKNRHPKMSNRTSPYDNRRNQAGSFSPSFPASKGYREGAIGEPSEKEQRELRQLQQKLFGSSSPPRWKRP